MGYLGGFLLGGVGVFGMLLFGASLFFNMSLGILWLYMELCGLCLIPLFFCGGGEIALSGLFYYIVFSGVSSSFLLIGFLLPEGLFCLLVGLLLKFGVFPLWGWVYRVCCFSNWFVVWGFSTILKISFILFPLFLVLGEALCGGVGVLCSLGLLLLSLFFWFFAYGWKVLWCHMMLSSSSVLVALGASGCGVFGLFVLYIVYVVWSTSVLLYLSVVVPTQPDFMGRYSVFLFSFLILSVPTSLSIFYKVVACCCIFSSGVLLLFCWVIYSLSEQLYLFLYVTGLYSGKFFGALLI